MRAAVVWAIASAWLLAVAPAARAQDVRITAPAPSAAADDTDKPLTPDESAVLERALTFDPADLTTRAPAKPLRLPDLSKPAALALKRDDKPDGSGTLAVKRPVAAGLDGVDADVGADVNFAAPPEAVYRPGQPLPGSAASDAGSSAAWASVGIPNLASLDARADPAHDQSKLAGTLKRSLPVGKQFSLTIQDSYSVTQTLGASTASAAPSTLPSPVTAAAAPDQIWGSEKSVKVDLKPTGTTFGAGFTTASNDPVTHNALSADQKIVGPLHVTTAVTDFGEPSESKSITAGFKLDW